MAEITLKVEPGRPLGTRPSGRLRAVGKIPGVVYGHGMEPIPVAVGARDLRAALTTESGLNALLSLKMGKDTHLAIAKELQRHPVRQTVTHVDFQVVRRDEIVTAEVRIALVGESEAVHRAEGTIDQEMLSLQIKAKPGDVPAVLEVDVSAMEIGDSLRVSDVKLPEGVTTDADPEAPVVIAHPPRIAEPEAVEAEAEAAEGAARSRGACRLRRGLRAGYLFRHSRAARPRAGDRPNVPTADLVAVGLGNPGVEYQGTRHNAGAEAVRIVARRHSARLKSEKGAGAETALVRIDGRALVLAVPQTYVNDSGLAVRALVRRYLAAEDTPGPEGRGRGPVVFPPGSLVIVHDELDLEPGVVRVKLGGGTAGHNGLRSIQSHLRHLDFVRIRIGVGKPPNPTAGADHVLRRASRARA